MDQESKEKVKCGKIKILQDVFSIASDIWGCLD